MLNETPSRQLQGMKRSKKKVVLNPNEVIPENVKRTRTKVKKEEPPKKIGSVAAYAMTHAEVVAQAIVAAVNSNLEYQVKNLVCIYRVASEFAAPLNPIQFRKHKTYLQEIIDCLQVFLAEGILPDRKMTFAEVIR